jgi:hypothetical protein
MKIVRKIDTNGYFVEDVVLEPTKKLATEAVLKNGEVVTPAVYKDVYKIPAMHVDIPVPEGMHKPKWDGTKWIETDTNISTYKQTARYAKLEQIFSDKTVGLKKIAIDKIWMTDPEAINNQYRVYEEMYKNALASRYDAATNTAIITANETTKAALSDLTLLLNSVRSAIEFAISADATNADELLAQADAISLGMADLTPAKFLEIKTMFGL